MNVEVLTLAEPLIVRNLDILGGTPVFSRTRVPIRVFFEYLEAGDRLDDFLENFPSVSRKQAIALLERASRDLSKFNDEAAA